MGCLLGQALGDALGFPVEGYPRLVCAAYTVEVAEGRLRGRGGLPFGQYTDDTQLARELLASGVAQPLGAVAMDDFAQRVAALFVEGRVVGRGMATEQAALRIAAGVPWQEAGTPAPSAGNGSAMRAAVVALLATSEAELVDLARLQGHVTHQDPRCAAGSIAIAAAAWCALHRPTLEAADIAALVAPHDAQLAAWIWALPATEGLSDASAVASLSRLGVPEGYTDGWAGSISPFVVGSVLWSLRCALLYPDDHLGAVLAAIRGGGDADTTAAMTGAIVGARVGASRLSPWVERVQDLGTWGRADLQALAEQAWRRRLSDGP